MRVLSVLMALLVGAALTDCHMMAQTRDDLRDAQRIERRKREMAQKVNRAQYDQFVFKNREEYTAYTKTLREQYDAYVNSIAALWGKEHVRESSAKKWVEYSDDKRSRSEVDFESGDVVVEVILEDYSKENADNHLRKALEQLEGSRGQVNPYSGDSEGKKPLQSTPILKDLLDDKGSSPKDIVANSNKNVTKVQGKDGKQRTLVSINMKLNENHLSQQALKYKDIIASCSTRFNIEQPLIYAIIEQESAFNPCAQSWAPAYGLMQLVPTSGGLDAYRYVYNRSWIPTPSYLFDPAHNVELGTAYLRKLTDTYASVKSAENRMLCVIASYNTGCGNVSRAFTGTTKLDSKLWNQINSHDSSSLYRFLTTNLKYEEARNYVKGVMRRREKYVVK